MWMNWGDQKTKFFHATASQRRKRNSIVGLLDSEGRWQADQRNIEGIILEYFGSIFKSNELVDFEASLSAIHPKVTPVMNATLTANFKAEEVWNAFQQMHPTKSPGPDGRQIMDNVLVAFETMHCINGRRKGNEALMTLKLDTSKAYDRVELGGDYAKIGV
ncbi:hypothetical protein SO802_001133 [Lithocarpus litseifolius]|uniref:Reverse transcriptase domain-containing protein n=1 Tax=Lithocarpus litseifolius TaxID=425828 RepID=A0AAW2DXA0_9ROSI